MANASAFSQGYATGQGIAEQQRALKEARKQTEWEDKHNDLREAVKNTQQKLWTLDKNSPTYAQDHAQGLQDLTSSIQAYQDFFHPQKNPGMWEKARHLVGMEGKPHPLQAPERVATETTPGVAASSVDLGDGPVATPATPEFKTSTAGPAPTPDEYSAKPLYPSQVKDRAERLKKSQQQAGLMEAGGPETPEAASDRKLNAQIAQIDKSPLSPEDKEEAKRKIFGIYARPSLQKYQLPDGTVQYYDAGRPDLIPDGATAYVKPDTASLQIDEFNKDVAGGYQGTYPQWLAEKKASGGKPRAVWAKDDQGKFYSVLLDPRTNQELPDSRNYGAVPPTSLVGRVTTGHYYWTDPATGELHDQPRTGYSGPAGGGGGTSSPPSSPESSQSPAAASGTPHTPHVPASSKSGGGSTGKDKIIGHKGTKDEIDTKTAYESAVDRVKIMEKNLAAGLRGDSQAMLSMVANHIGMTLGAQKGARINQAVWNEAIESTPWLKKIEAKWGPDGYISGVTLAPEQMKQMVELAHERTEILKEHLDRLQQQREEQEHPKGPGDVKNEANKTQWPNAPDIGTVEQGSKGKHKYIGGDPHKPENWSLVKQ